MVHRHLVVFLVAFCLFISLPLFAITRSWTGAVSANWSAPANWSPAGPPDASDSLVFPAGASNKTMTNDLPALSVGPMTFSDGYTVNGNELTLTGNVSMTQGSFNAPLRVGGTIHIGETGAYNSYGTIDVNGQALTIDAGNASVVSLNGSGTVLVAGGGIVFTGDGSFNGTISEAISVRSSM